MNNNLFQIIAALADPLRQLEAITVITKLLSIVEVFKTPTGIELEREERVLIGGREKSDCR